MASTAALVIASYHCFSADSLVVQALRRPKKIAKWMRKSVCSVHLDLSFDANEVQVKNQDSHECVEEGLQPELSGATK